MVGSSISPPFVKKHKPNKQNSPSFVALIVNKTTSSLLMDIFTWFSPPGSSPFVSTNSWPCSLISMMCTSLLQSFEYTSPDKLQLTETKFSSRSLAFGWFIGSGVYDVRSGLKGTSSEHSSRTSFSFLLPSKVLFAVRTSKCSSSAECSILKLHELAAFFPNFQWNS